MQEKNLVDLLNPEERSELFYLVCKIVETLRAQLEIVLSSETRKSTFLSDMARKNPNVVQSAEPGTAPSNLREVQQAQQVQNALEIKKSIGAKLLELKPAATASFDTWEEAFIHRIAEAVCGDDASKGRVEVMKPISTTSSHTELKHWSTRIDTPLTAVVSAEKMPLVLHAFLLLSLSLGSYDPRSRTVLLHLCHSLNVPIVTLLQQESATAHALVIADQSGSGSSPDFHLTLPNSSEITTEPQVQKRIDENQTSRRWKIGLASVAGAVLVGVTGGLAAPPVAAGLGTLLGGIGLGGTVAAGYLGAMAASAPLVGGLFGAYGGKMTGDMMRRYANEVQDFAFIPLRPKLESKLRVVVCISGWLADEKQIVSPWASFGDSASVYALRWETQALMDLGSALDTFVRQYAVGYIKSEIIKRTVLASLWSALWPLGLLKIAKVVDNPFNIAMTRSDKAGLVLADVIINRAQGNRPVTLVGYSLGARVIYNCLMSLAERKAFGLVDTAVLMGAPVPSATESWAMMKSVVGGRLINIYSSDDWVLGFLYRTSAIQLGVAGLQAVEGVVGVENFDVSGIVDGHIKYAQSVQQILAPILDADVHVVQ